MPFFTRVVRWPANAGRLFSMSSGARAWRLAATAAVVTALAACGAPREPGTYLLDDLANDTNMPDAGWEDLRKELPPVPTAADTLPIEPLAVERSRTFTFGVDPRSVRVAPGHVVRYTLYSRSDRGAESVTYESLRCRSAEWRMVAIMRKGSGWERPSDEEWRAIERDSVRSSLRAGVFCTGRGVASPKPADLVYRLRNWERYADASFRDVP